MLGLEIPILGINTGRLGFLASIAQDQIMVAIDKLLTGDYEIEVAFRASSADGSQGGTGVARRCDYEISHVVL